MEYYEIDYDTLGVIDQQLYYKLFKEISNGHVLHCTILMHNILILSNTNYQLLFPIQLTLWLPLVIKITRGWFFVVFGLEKWHTPKRHLMILPQLFMADFVDKIITVKMSIWKCQFS